MVFESLRSSKRVGALPMAAFLGLLLLVLHLMSDAVQQSAELTRWYVPLLVVSVAGLLVLAGMLVVDVSRLVTRYRRQAAGSRLTGRMVVLFALLSLVPASIVYYYSLGFLLKGIDSWFDVEIDKAMKDALTLSQDSLGLNQRLLLKYTTLLIRDIDDQSETALALALDDMRQAAGATELTLMNSNGQVIVSSHYDPTVLVPDRPAGEIMQLLKSGSDYVGLSPEDGELQIRVLVRDPLGRPLVLQGLYPTSEHISMLSSGLETAYNRYLELSYLRKSLKFSFSLTLFIVLMFSLLSSLLMAFLSARRFVSPIARIAEGTQAVAQGDYSQRLPVPRYRDELGFLVSSFNLMTKRLEQARDHELEAKQQVEGQRTYLETVLGCLSSGVITVDDELTLRTVNPAARDILKLDLDPFIDRPIADLAGASGRMGQLVDRLQVALNDKLQEWREEVVLSGEGNQRQILMCRITPFTQPGGEAQQGHVVLFDDITALIQAQRDAAWGEVARRLAHEIKNPLTPIQLAAERLRRKYLGHMPEKDAEVLDRSTHTIVQQVEAMKTMVNAFSDYARLPQMKTETVKVDQLFAEVLELYRTDTRGVDIRVDLQAGAASIQADPVQLRQMVHNLVKNALEAVADMEAAWVNIRTRLLRHDGGSVVELRIEDNGPGFDESVLSSLFEPYVTTKTKGTGLGMAIVKRIVEEHGGSILAENGETGACVIVRLPARASVVDAEPLGVAENASAG